MLFSVCRSFMPGCQRCHFRLKASVQWLENNIRRYRNSLAIIAGDALEREQPPCPRFPMSWTSVVMLTDACDLGVRTVTASQVQYIVKLFVIPATIQRQAPTIKTVQGAVDVCQFQCLDRVVRRRVWKVLERCSQGGVYRRQCPCWEATPSIDRPDRAEVSGSPSESLS